MGLMKGLATKGRRSTSGRSRGGSTGAVIDISMIGDKALQRKLEKLADPKLQRDIVVESAMIAGQPVLEEAKRQAPVKSGLMRDTLRLKKARAMKLPGARMSTGTRKQMGIDPKSPWYYPAHIEYGFYNQRVRRHIPANPFMRRALDMRRPQAIELFEKALRSRLYGEV